MTKARRVRWVEQRKVNFCIKRVIHPGHFKQKYSGFFHCEYNANIKEIFYWKYPDCNMKIRFHVKKMWYLNINFYVVFILCNLELTFIQNNREFIFLKWHMASIHSKKFHIWTIDSVLSGHLINNRCWNVDVSYLPGLKIYVLWNDARNSTVQLPVSHIV